MTKHQCTICHQVFSSAHRLQSHLNRKTPCQPISESSTETLKNLNLAIKLKPPESFACQFCKKEFARKDNILAHLKKNRCTAVNEMDDPAHLKDKVSFLEKQIEELKRIPFSHLKQIEDKLVENGEQFEQFKEKLIKNEEKIAHLEQSGSKIVNNNLQIVCIGNNDNYLDMLTEQWGSFEKALEYIKDCALSHLTGDCKLLEKIYMNNGNENGPKSIRFTDKSRTKIEYRNENNEIVRDTKELFGRKLANNLQKSYLKGVNFLLTRNLESRGCPNKFLEEYDLQTWNGHIYELSDIKYHKKIINQLNIPQVD